MVKQLGDRLPTFTPQEAQLLRGSNDYFGLNHFCARYIKHRITPPTEEDAEGNVDILNENKEGESIGPETESAWLFPHPPGFRKILKWVHERYGRPIIFVTENGTSIKGENDLPKAQILEDNFRAWYFTQYIQSMVEARVLDGVNVIGYMAWSLLE
jgi:beta-glucosidase